MEPALRALANERRLKILDWLKDPEAHFPPQVDGDLVEDGVCGVLIARRFAISQPTASEHLRILAAAGLIRGRRIKQWTFYKRDPEKSLSLKVWMQDDGGWADPLEDGPHVISTFEYPLADARGSATTRP
jgi:DNA-binding transcriptional ArsR family regulator